MANSRNLRPNLGRPECGLTRQMAKQFDMPDCAQIAGEACQRHFCAAQRSRKDAVWRAGQFKEWSTNILFGGTCLTFSLGEALLEPTKILKGINCALILCLPACWRRNLDPPPPLTT